MKTSELSIACLQAYVAKSRDVAEAIISDDFRFTSPFDNQIDRSTYFERCWPNSKVMKSVRIIEAVDDGDRAFVIYEAEMEKRRFRNCEMHTSRNGKLVAVEVYFGWDLPHPAAIGGFVTD